MKTIHVEILTPKQNSKDLDGDLERFADRFMRCMEDGHTVSIPDNPMGRPGFQATEVLLDLELTVIPSQLLIHLNTFHTKDDLDRMIAAAIEMGCRELLIVTGDGGERLSKLSPESIGVEANSVTAVELLHYVHREYPGTFTCGVAFNPYEPQDHELEKMQRKIDAGAAFVITQPVTGEDARVKELLTAFDIPVTLGVWMSKRLHLLSECIGYEIPEDQPYDPIETLRAINASYQDCGLYLALLGFKTQYPMLADILGA